MRPSSKKTARNGASKYDANGKVLSKHNESKEKGEKGEKY